MRAMLSPAKWLATLRAFMTRPPTEPADNVDIVPPGDPELGPDTIDYLDRLATRSFDRQTDLDESIWRSLPFFAASFAFVATLVGRSAVDVPDLAASAYAIGTNLMQFGATASLAWGLRWFWTVLRPREYEYPAPDEAVRRYAEQIVAYHGASGVTGAALDAKVARDVKLFMIEQHGSGASVNLAHNAVKLKGRSKVLLFMLLSFVLAFACEATIFIHGRLYGQAVRLEEVTNVTGSASTTSAEQATGASSSGASSGSAGYGRGTFLGTQLKGESQVQMTSGKPAGGKPQQSVTIAKPRPPAMQVVAKQDSGHRVQASVGRGAKTKAE